MKFVERRFSNLWVIRSRFLRKILDFQFFTIWMSLKKFLNENRTTQFSEVLDFGSGIKPSWRLLFANEIKYWRLDPFVFSDFSSIDSIPKGQKFDLILAIEVLEHICEPEKNLRQLADLLTNTGLIYISVPFSARVHGAPEDYLRWTSLALKKMIINSGLKLVRLENRGTDLTSIIQKISFFLFRRRLIFWHWPWLIPCLVFHILILIPLGHLSLFFHLGYDDDPLGYSAVLSRVNEPNSFGPQFDSAT